MRIEAISQFKIGMKIGNWAIRLVTFFVAVATALTTSLITRSISSSLDATSSATSSRPNWPLVSDAFCANSLCQSANCCCRVLSSPSVAASEFFFDCCSFRPSANS